MLLSLKLDLPALFIKNWDNHLTKNNRQYILNTTTINQIIQDESSAQTIDNIVPEDATTTLLYRIAKHFFGEP